MALELLVQRIRAEAEREVRALLDEADREVERLSAEVRSQIEALHRRDAEALRARLTAAAQVECAQREAEARRALMTEREEILNETRRRWEAWLRDLPPDEEARLLRAMLESARGIVPEGEIAVSPRTRERLGPVAGPLTTVTDETAGPGLRVKSRDGRVVADLTFDSVAREFWARHRPGLAGTLFGDALVIGRPTT